MTLLNSALVFFLSPFEAEPPPGPLHSFRIRMGGSGASIGYNAVAGSGRVLSGSASYNTRAGKAVTVIHCRNVRSSIVNFALSASPAAVLADFPTRIVVTNDDGPVVTLARPGSVRSISGGVRADYTATEGTITDVFTLAGDGSDDITVDLYYDPVEVAGVATLTFPNANSVRSELTDANGIRSVQLVEFILPGGSALNDSFPTRLSENSWRGQVSLGTFGQWSVTWVYTDSLGANKRATARATRTL